MFAQFQKQHPELKVPALLHQEVMMVLQLLLLRPSLFQAKQISLRKWKESEANQSERRKASNKASGWEEQIRAGVLLSFFLRPGEELYEMLTVFSWEEQIRLILFNLCCCCRC